MIALKKRLEEQLEKLTEETKEVQATLDAVNQILLEKGFKRGDIKEVPIMSTPIPQEVVLPKHEPEPPKPAPTQQHTEPESVIPLKTMADEPLALMYFEKQTIHVTSTGELSVSSPRRNRRGRWHPRGGSSFGSGLLAISVSRCHREKTGNRPSPMQYRPRPWPSPTTRGRQHGPRRVGRDPHPRGHNCGGAGRPLVLRHR